MGSAGDRRFYNIINGEERTAKNTHRVTDPRTEELLWEVPIATTQDLEEAVTAAAKAFQSWKWSTLSERQEVLGKICQVIEEHAAELADIARKETGKSTLLGQIEIGNTTRQIKVIASQAPEDHVQHEDSEVKILATHQPLGIVAAICPWNFPVILSTIKIASALITGNCVIVKPSPFTPYAVLKLVELCQAVVPPGVFQALNGGADLGAKMTTHEKIAKVSFTGTVATGKKIMAACAPTLKRLTLELAGNDAAIVCPDVDIAQAVEQTATGSFFNAGQMCVATKRIYVHEDVYDAFLAKFRQEVKEKYQIVDEEDAPSLFGPVSNKLQLDTVKRILADAKERGLKTESFEHGIPEKGYWVPATIVSDATEDALVVQEEQFGPIIPILRWRDEKDVLARVNLENAGLGAAIYSRDVAYAERLARRVEAGSVYINKFEIPNENAFFSGFKSSGLGGELGKQGLLSYCYTQSIHISKVSPY